MLLVGSWVHILFIFDDKDYLVRVDVKNAASRFP